MPHAPPTIRICREDDCDVVRELFAGGRLTGPLQAGRGDGEDESDLLDLKGAYIENESASLWVAELEDAGVIGMVAVRCAGGDAGELRRLRVHPDYRHRGIGSALVGHALAYCKEQSYLKIVLDTFVDRTAAIALFEKFGFKLAKSRQVDGRERLDFYLDLYRDAAGE